MSGRADLPVSVRVPELGPSLGRMVASASTPSDLDWISLDEIRWALVTTVLEMAGEAREWSASADRDLVLGALGRASWLEAWERALSAAVERVVLELDARLTEAAVESRLPRRLLRGWLVTPADRRAIAGRLGGGAAPFLAALDSLEEAVSPLRGAHALDPAAHEAWQRALTTVARRLESAWLALQQATAQEWAGWVSEVERVRAWRRPLWSLWLIGAALFGVATYLGLVLGGYLPLPGFLKGFASAWWRGW